MISFAAFADELSKIAEEGRLSAIRRLPADSSKAIARIGEKIDSSRSKILGFPSVAVPVKALGDLKDHGFKETRVAVPLPWEPPGTPSWRKGNLHAHKMGDYFVMHKDEIAPSGVIAGVRHWAHEGLPALKKRFVEGEAGVTIKR